MLFNSPIFLLIFAPVVYVLYWRLAPGQSRRLGLLIAASYVFYANWDWRFVFLLGGVTLMTYVSGRGLAAARTPGRRKVWLWAGVGAPLLLLGVFKYADFAVSSLDSLLGALVPGFGLSLPDVLLPVGISFFTFQAISTIVDLYRGKLEAAPDLLHLTAYMALFPQLIAGPIARYVNLGPQLDALPPRLEDDRLYSGLTVFILGLAKKVLIADSLGQIVDPLLIRYTEFHLVAAWGVMVAYSLQLYFDFSAYSEMAVGLGRLLGLELPVNFNRPYRSHNISEFWERWHITLSTWLRDYLYIPLGGSRKGLPRTLINLVITMALGGLWHGAAWTFVIWGLYHGGMLVIYHATRGRQPIRWRGLSWLLTFAGVVIGWVFFRSTSPEMAFHIIGSMVGLHGLGLADVQALLGFRLLALLGLCALIEWRVPALATLQLPKGTTQVPRLWGWVPPALQAAVLIVLLVASILSLDQAQQFLYFRF